MMIRFYEYAGFTYAEGCAAVEARSVGAHVNVYSTFEDDLLCLDVDPYYLQGPLEVDISFYRFAPGPNSTSLPRRVQRVFDPKDPTASLVLARQLAAADKQERVQKALLSAIEQLQLTVSDLRGEVRELKELKRSREPLPSRSSPPLPDPFGYRAYLDVRKEES